MCTHEEYINAVRAIAAARIGDAEFRAKIAGAKLIYGVVVDPATLQIDETATAKLRASRPGGRFEAVINEKTMDIELKPSTEELENIQ